MFNSTNRLKKTITVSWFSYQKDWFPNLSKQSEEIMFPPNQLQDEIQPWCVLRNACKRFMYSLGGGVGGGVTSFPALCIFASATSSATCFPAFGTGCVFSHAGFLSFTPLTYFPAIGAVNVFWYVCNGLAFTRRHNQSLDFASTLISLYVYGRRVF